MKIVVFIVIIAIVKGKDAIVDDPARPAMVSASHRTTSRPLPVF